MSPEEEWGEQRRAFPMEEERITWTRWIICVSIAVSSIAFAFTSIALLESGHKNRGPQTHEQHIINATIHSSESIRREWRSLNTTERDNYIAAVKCLKEQPSKLDMPQSLYDDFAYIHNHFDKDVHFAASFLPWHRYFIYTYHRALVEKCNYNGELPYWDWSLDWRSLFSSPIWDIEHGFSGNGVASSESSTLFPRSHCVSKGLFANFEVVYAGSTLSPHCLTRDFGSGEPIEALMKKIQPSALEKLLLQNDYYHFLILLEAGPHLSIPKAIMGDFSLFTAPNDPIFFLHHAQIDRLWWLWEQYDISRRRNAYSGNFKARSKQQASQEDIISIGLLAPEIQVKDVLSLRSSFLHYNYE